MKGFYGIQCLKCGYLAEFHTVRGPITHGFHMPTARKSKRVERIERFAERERQ